MSTVDNHFEREWEAALPTGEFWALVDVVVAGFSLGQASVDVAVDRVREALWRTDPSAIESPVAYVRRALVNSLLTEVAKSRRTISSSDAPDLLGASADPAGLIVDRQALSEGLRAAHADGEYEAVETAVAWLDLHDLHGRSPTQAEVAAILRVSQATISNRLAKLRRYLPSP